MRKLRRSSSHFSDSLRMLRIKEQEGNRRASLSPERVVVMRSSINRRQSTIGLVGKSPRGVSPVRHSEGSSSPGGTTSRELGGSTRELGGSSRELGGSSRELGGSSSSPIRSLDGSGSDARSRERWRSMARRGSAAEGQSPSQSGSGAKRKSERKGSSSAGSCRPPRSNYWRLPGVQEDE